MGHAWLVLTRYRASTQVLEKYMSYPVIQISGLSKRYRLGEYSSDTQLREAVMRGMSKLFRRERKEVKNIWAVRDVTFEVERGEVLGIVGRNGAGKSTLLKLLSRITAPTSGSIKVAGRIASLLAAPWSQPVVTGQRAMIFPSLKPAKAMRISRSIASNLLPGRYYLSLWLGKWDHQQDVLKNCIHFDVENPRTITDRAEGLRASSARCFSLRAGNPARPRRPAINAGQLTQSPLHG